MIQRSGSMSRMDVINALIEKNNYKTYLEIGCQNDICFNAIKCEVKIGVDPEKGGTHRMTSDKFFDTHKHSNFDIIFVDGLHHSEQVYKDILNSLQILNEGGIILCHDMIPSSEEAQIVPRITKHWNGDCWKAFVALRCNNDGEYLEMKTIQTDCGLGIIRKSKEKIERLKIFYPELRYKEFELHQKNWLNAITVEEFKEIYL